MSTRNAAIADAETIALRSAEAEVAFRMDEDAFRGFYDRTARILWVYLRRLTGDRHLADDLLQEAYYRFLRADPSLENESHRRRYLFQIATNLVRDGARASLRRPVFVSHDDDLPSGAETAADEALDRGLAVNQALARLGRRERALLWLAYAQGASHKEIAAIVGVKAASVKSLLYRARRRLASLLQTKQKERRP
jgi:RNA polymerase sigma-70 factor (ECF subfamily)